MIDIDARGTPCPIPLIKTMNCMKKNPSETICVFVDGATPKENVTALAQRQGYTCDATQIDTGFKLVLIPKKSS
jgi:TusA-related sulfurtransferase